MKAKKYALIVREGDEQRTLFIGPLETVVYRAELLVLAGEACGIMPIV